MTISAKVILDSRNENGDRLVTLQLKYPRMVHSELMTHRVFSRNASSSRAIPVAKIIATIQEDVLYPSYWGKNQPGMQAEEELSESEIVIAKDIWDRARISAISYAEEMIKLGVHKQIANRILEPFSHIQVIVSSTQWSNFFALRRHKDAQPEIRILAEAMYEEMENSVSTLLKPGEWHLPYITDKDKEIVRDVSVLQKMSAARAARVSYLTHEGKSPSIEEDLLLYNRLVIREYNTDPIHASPTEHQATPDIKNYGKWEKPELHGNFNGFIQYRKTIQGESK